MATATGFGLGDAPFTSSGFGSFTDLSRSVAASVNAPSSSTGGGATSTGNGGFMNNLLGAVGNGLARVADFGTQLFFYDELAERGQVPTTNTTQTTATLNQQTAEASTSLIKGISNEALMIGGAVALLVLLLLFKWAK